MTEEPSVAKSPATAEPPQLSEALPTRQRATAAETRLTAAEWGLLSVLTLMQFSVTLDFIIIAPLGPQLMRVFGINTEQFSYTVAAYAFGAALSAFSAAFFLDRFDRKRALLVLFSGFTVGTLCCALAPSYGTMLAARFMTGIFGGVCGGVVLAIVGDAIPEIRRATAMGTIMSAFALASALGVPAGLWMAEHGWHWPFLILGITCAVIIPFAIWLLPRSDSHLRAPRTESAGSRMWAVVAKGRHLRAFALMAGLTTAGFMVVPFISTFMVRNVGLTESQLKYNFLSGGLFTLFSMNLVGRLADMYGRMKIFAIMAIFSTGAVLWLTHLTTAPLYVAIGVTTVFMVTMTGPLRPGDRDDHGQRGRPSPGRVHEPELLRAEHLLGGGNQHRRLPDHRPRPSSLYNTSGWSGGSRRVSPSCASVWLRACAVRWRRPGRWSSKCRRRVEPFSSRALHVVWRAVIDYCKFFAINAIVAVWV